MGTPQQIFQQNKRIIRNNLGNKMNILLQAFQSRSLQKDSSKNLSTSFTSKRMEKINIFKRRKVSIMNGHILKKHTDQGKNINEKYISVQLPPSNVTEKMKTNPKIFDSTLYVKLLSPIKKAPSVISEKQSQKSQSNKKQVSSRISRVSLSRNLSYECEQNFYHMQEMKKIASFLNEQKMEKRLNLYSKQKGKVQLRIYKQDIHKIIVYRFGKDRITTLLNTEYIEDFDSILKTMKQMTTLKKQQLLLMTFLIMDQNKDGLITPEDLVSLIGVKKQNSSSVNQLITHDVLKIVSYINVMKQRGIQIKDNINNELLKDQKLTFMKYRITKLKEKKLKKSAQAPKTNIMTCKMHDHLYSLQEEAELEEKFKEQQSQMTFHEVLLKMIKSNNSKENELLMGESQTFAINLQRYSQIFSNEIPKIFLDFLYLFGGIEIPNVKYLPLDVEAALTSSQKQAKQIKEENKMEQMLKYLQEMNTFKRQLKTLRVSTEPLNNHKK